MARGTVALINVKTALLAIDCGACYAVARIVGTWEPQLGQRVTGDLYSLGGTDLRDDGGRLRTVFIEHVDCTREFALKVLA